MFIVSEEEYLSHYGRKGMKWYQHIFGDDSEVSRDIKKIKKDILNSSDYSKIKTAGELGVMGTLAAIGGKTLGGKIGEAAAYSKMVKITSHIGMNFPSNNGLTNEAIEKTIVSYLNKPTVQEVFRATSIGSITGVSVAVGLTLLGYGTYKGVKYIKNRKNNTKVKKSSGKKVKAKKTNFDPTISLEEFQKWW